MVLSLNGNSEYISKGVKETNTDKKSKKQMYKDLKIRNTKYCFLTKFLNIYIRIK